MEHLSDHGLLALIGRGDRDAFARLYDMYGAAAYSLALRIVRDRELAADVVQNVFLAVWTQATQFDPVARAALDVDHDDDSSQGSRHRAAGAAAPDGAARRRAGEPRSASRRSTSRRGAASPASRSREALARLPDPHREVIELAYFAGLLAVGARRAAGGAHRHRQEPHVRGDERAARGACGGWPETRRTSGTRRRADLRATPWARSPPRTRSASSLHLAECERCRRRLREAEAVAASLAYGVPAGRSPARPAQAACSRSPSRSSRLRRPRPRPSRPLAGPARSRRVWWPRFAAVAVPVDGARARRHAGLERLAAETT